MATKAIWVMLKAKPGKEDAVEAFLKAGGAVMSQERAADGDMVWSEGGAGDVWRLPPIPRSTMRPDDF